MYNPNNGRSNRPTINGRTTDDERAQPRYVPQGQGNQLGGGLVSGPQQAAEQREHLNAMERQRRIQERAEKERIEAERKKREDAEKLAARRKNVENLKKKTAELQQERQRQVRDAWNSRLPSEIQADKALSPSRSKSHQPPPPGTPDFVVNEDVGPPSEKFKRAQAARRDRRENNTTIDITDDDAELQRALQASLGDASPDVHYVNDSPIQDNYGIEDEDEELQRVLMMSALEQSKPSTTPSSSTSTSTSTSSPATLPQAHTTTTSSFTTTSTSSRVVPPVVEVDDDVDMDLTEDAELQDALMKSMEQKPTVPDKASEKRTRIFGEDVSAASTTVNPEAGKTRVYGVDDDDDDDDDDVIDEVNDAELQDALRLSRQVIDVDQEPDQASSQPRGPVVTSIDDDVEEVEGERVGAMEDEDEELQRALMSSLNPNPSPPNPHQPLYPSSPSLSSIYQQRQRQTQPVDPGVANARRIRNEQDWAYQQSLAEDREKERKANEEKEQARIQKEQEEKAAQQKEMEEQARRDIRDKAGSLLPQEPADGITLGIRMPNGTRFMRKFSPSDKLRDLRNFIESKANESGLAYTYEITSDFPKRTFHDLSPDQSLSEAGISGRMLLNISEKA